MRLVLSGGRLLDPASATDAIGELAIAHGVVISVGRRPDGFTPDRVIDCTGCVIAPGLVDLSVRLREPGQEYKATIASECAAAAASGVTTVCCPPDTDPPIDTPAVAELIGHRARQTGLARVLPTGALTHGLAGKQLSEMAALKEAGCTAVSNALVPLASALVERRALEYAATHGLTVILHAEDAALREGGFMHEGVVACRLGVPGIPEAAETVAVARDLALIEQSGARAHFGRLSTGRAVRMVARSRYDGLPVTVDVAAHQLFLTEDDLEDFDANLHLDPPVRTARDREMLRKGLAEGAIAVVTSDHQPHDPDAKLTPFTETQPGATGLDTLLPLVLAVAREENLPLVQALSWVTCAPARVLGIEAGELRPGRAADVCVFDPDLEWTVTPHTLASRGHNSPFLGRTLRGRAVLTLLDGRVVFERPREAAQRRSA